MGDVFVIRLLLDSYAVGGGGGSLKRVGQNRASSWESKEIVSFKNKKITLLRQLLTKDGNGRLISVNINFKIGQEYPRLLTTAVCMCNACTSCHCLTIPTSPTVLSISGIPLRVCGLFSTLCWPPGSGNSQCGAPLSPRESGQGPSSNRDGRREEAASRRKASGPTLTQQQPWRWPPLELLGIWRQSVLLLF